MMHSAAATIDILKLRTAQHACLFLTVVTMLNFLISEAASEAQDFCQSETFRPRCLPSEAVIVTKAIYGRMSFHSRCLEDEEELPALRDDPKYMGCFEDVLHLVSARCSGRSDCEIRVPDPEMEKTNPCHRNMVKYLVVTYQCITVSQPDRSCEIRVNTDNVFLSPVISNDRSANVQCGNRERQWLLEAPSGQRINISLLDFTSSSQRPRAADTESLSGCERQFGFIEDKSANRNIDICSDTAHSQRTLYVSKRNAVAIVLASRDLYNTDQSAGNILISVKAVGCSDLVPPSDAWLKRSDNVATVGCFMTRQTWVLTCDQSGRWTGTFGNCTQQLLAVHESRDDDVIVRSAQSQQRTSEDIKVIILVLIIGVSAIVCVAIICIGSTWLCRLRGRKSREHMYGGDDLMTSLDVKPVAQ